MPAKVPRLRTVKEQSGKAVVVTHEAQASEGCRATQSGLGGRGRTARSRRWQAVTASMEFLSLVRLETLESQTVLSTGLYLKKTVDAQ